MFAIDAQHALELLFQKHYLRLLRQAIAIVGGKEDAEDVLADAAINILIRVSHGHAPNGNLLAWLYRCVLNAAIDWRRRQRTRQTADNEYSATKYDAANNHGVAEFEPPDRNPCPEQEVSLAEYRQAGSSTSTRTSTASVACSRVTISQTTARRSRNELQSSTRLKTTSSKYGTSTKPNSKPASKGTGSRRIRSRKSKMERNNGMPWDKLIAESRFLRSIRRPVDDAKQLAEWIKAYRQVLQCPKMKPETSLIERYSGRFCTSRPGWILLGTPRASNRLRLAPRQVSHFAQHRP